MSVRTRDFVAPAAYGCGFVRPLVSRVFSLRELDPSVVVLAEGGMQEAVVIHHCVGRARDAALLIWRHCPAVWNGCCRGRGGGERCREAAHRQMWKKVEHGGMGGGGEA
jgi:hypothetical protein